MRTIKDGMGVLSQKYSLYHNISTSTTVTGTTTIFSASDRKNILGTVAYNGIDCGYVKDVATKLNNINAYFPNATTSGVTDLIGKMYFVGQHNVCADLHSPGDLSIQDSKGDIIGVVNGQEVNTFPLAIYDESKSAKILATDPNGNYVYKVTGTDAGVYGLDITNIDEDSTINFTAEEGIPITPKEVHTYTIDKTKVSTGEDWVTVLIDKNGDGINDFEVTSKKDLTADEFAKMTPLKTSSNDDKIIK